jgi:hypothetical protein
MPFASYGAVGEVARAYQITLRQDDFVMPVDRSVSEYFRSELAFTQSHVAVDSSEFAACENLIYPVLKEVWKSFTDDFVLWSHLPLDYDADVCETPDYFLARRSPLGLWVMDKPYLVVVEAKRDDFTRGWAQCLAALLAAQRLNDLPDQTLYGITTTGQVWQFGKLNAATFTRNSRLFILSDLDELCGAVHYAFEQCRQQLAGQPCSP